MDAETLVERVATAIHDLTKGALPSDISAEDLARAALREIVAAAGGAVHARIAADDLAARALCGSHPEFVQPRENAAALLRALAEGGKDGR